MQQFMPSNLIYPIHSNLQHHPFLVQDTWVAIIFNNSCSLSKRITSYSIFMMQWNPGRRFFYSLLLPIFLPEHPLNLYLQFCCQDQFWCNAFMLLENKSNLAFDAPFSDLNIYFAKKILSSSILLFLVYCLENGEPWVLVPLWAQNSAQINDTLIMIKL